ncbi:hypothetical protein LNP74_29155 [Klebsiella pneumoniae subsp. pneumoniae]|nr:hypothetical protein [Klebsiella pneumoniae subsp. pneumoniae]
MIPTNFSGARGSSTGAEFLQVLEQQGFTGDTATSYADRLTMATDNSTPISCCRMRSFFLDPRRTWRCWRASPPNRAF